MGTRYQIPYQYLEKYNKQPTPDIPKYNILAAVHFAIMHQFATPTNEVDCMPGINDNKLLIKKLS